MVSGRARGFSGPGALAVGKIPERLALRVGLWAVLLVLSMAFEVLFRVPVHRVPVCERLSWGGIL